MSACKPHATSMSIACIIFVAQMPQYYTKPEYSRRAVNRAGEVLINNSASEEERDESLTIINNWRASHNYPLNTFQMRLRQIAKNINPDSLVAQRIKRLASIKYKLERIPGMNMAQIQDIGGCRAIMKDASEVDTLVNIYKHESRGIKHKLAKEDDYIIQPKESGYRGVHLVYKYRSDKNKHYEDMRIEIQVRTLVQHAWATAVETVGTFIKQSLKSSQGEPEWLRFFALMSSAMAIEEGKPIVPNTPDNFVALRTEITRLAEFLNVDGHLTAFRKSIEILGGDKRITNAHYYLLELDPTAGRIIIKSYAQTQLATASSDYLTLEKRIANDNRNAVLVSAESIEALKLAFPNYYLDTDIFLNHLRNLTGNGQLSLF